MLEKDSRIVIMDEVLSGIKVFLKITLQLQCHQCLIYGLVMFCRGCDFFVKVTGDFCHICHFSKGAEVVCLGRIFL